MESLRAYNLKLVANILPLNVAEHFLKKQVRKEEVCIVKSVQGLQASFRAYNFKLVTNILPLNNAKHFLKKQVRKEEVCIPEIKYRPPAVSQTRLSQKPHVELIPHPRASLPICYCIMTLLVSNSVMTKTRVCRSDNLLPTEKEH